MEKKAQMTFIIFIALFILFLSVLIFYAAYNLKNKNPAESLIFERASIENYINNCAKKTAENSLILLGKQGSLDIDNSLLLQDLNIRYYYKNGNKIVSIDGLQKQLSEYINNNLNTCLSSFKDFKKQGWEVEEEIPNTKTQINENDVSFEIIYPIKISNKGNAINFDRFKAQVDVRLKYFHNIISNIVDFYALNPKSINRISLSKYNVHIRIFPYKGSLVFELTDQKSLITNKPYKFVFALE